MSEVARAAGLIGCAGLAVLLLASRRDLRLAALSALVLGEAGLAAYLAPDVSAGLVAGAAAIGAVAAVGGAWLLLRYPYVLAFATLACIPTRVPVDLGDEEANLLLPLYVVVAALTLALAWRIARGDERSRELGPLALPVAAFSAWTGLTLLWTADLREGSIFLGAFVLPFGLLALGFARLPWRGRWLTWLWVALVGTALAYALVGGYQWATREVFWNPKVAVGNAYAPFFRVNSVFWDPSIYGRYLVVAIIATLAGVLLAGVRGLRLAGLYAVAAATWIGLLLSFSQSSFVALAAGVVASALIAWSWRAAAAIALASALALAVAFSVPPVRAEILDQSRAGLDQATSGRSGLVRQGLEIALDNPVEGVGVGGFKRAYADRLGLRGENPRRAASHSTPITVAAEGGLPGLALLVWLVAAALLGTLRDLGQGFTSRVSLAVGLAILAIFVHSLFYNALFEDPMFWAFLGLVALATRVPRREAR